MAKKNIKELREAAEAVARRTMDAYSYPNYGSDNWLAAALYLIVQAGWTEREAEAILRSKWTRWAGDMAGHEGNTTAADLKAYMNAPRNRCDRAGVERLVRETFPAGADLAGACEGEDIAELIDLAHALLRTTDRGLLLESDRKALRVSAETILARIEGRAK